MLVNFNVPPVRVYFEVTGTDWKGYVAPGGICVLREGTEVEADEIIVDAAGFACLTGYVPKREQRGFDRRLLFTTMYGMGEIPIEYQLLVDIASAAVNVWSMEPDCGERKEAWDLLSESVVVSATEPKAKSEPSVIPVTSEEYPRSDCQP